MCYSYKQTAYNDCPCSGRLDIVKFLVANKAFVAMPNIYNNTCLMIASHRGHLDVVEFLLGEGMNPNKQARCGATALHYAAESGHMEICEMLLSHGAVIKRNEYGELELFRAFSQLFLFTRRVIVCKIDQ